MKVVQGFGSYSTNDINQSQKFYSDTLGLDAEIDEKMGIMRVKYSGGEVMVYPKDDHQAATFTVFNLVVEDIETVAAELKDKGVKFEHYDSEQLKTDENGLTDGSFGPKMGWFKDPGDNIISLIAAH